MKLKTILFTIAASIAMVSSFAQNPNYGDTLLNKKILEYRTIDKDGNIKWKNASDKAYLDTIIPIFSQFAIGSNVAAKNVTQLTAEVASKDTKLSYNIAGFLMSRYLIYNIELFSTGKDNVGSIFSDRKFQGNFGANFGVSILRWSSMYLNPVKASKLHEDRIRYFSVIKEKADLALNAKVKNGLSERIAALEKRLAGPDSRRTSKKKIYAEIIKLEDSLKKIAAPEDLENFYDEEIAAYDKKNAKWTGFNLLTFDLKAGFSSDGFTYYQKNSVTGFPELYENTSRFTRKSFGGAFNFVHVNNWISGKVSLGASYADFKGFDSQSTKSINQVTKNDSANVSRNFEKKYTAYELKKGSLDEFGGLISVINAQAFFLKDKMFGLGFTRQLTNHYGGADKDDTVIDDSFSLLLSLSKKGDLFNRNVLAITIKTPDLNNRLEKSFDTDTGIPYTTRQKMEVAVTFGLTIDKLFYKK